MMADTYLQQILWTPKTRRLTPIQDTLDAIDRGEEVNLSVPFDDTVEIFQSIENTELLKCLFKDRKTTTSFRYVSNNIIKYIDDNNKFSIFPIHSGRVRVEIDALDMQVHEIEQEHNEITMAYCNYKDKTNKTQNIDYNAFKIFSEQLSEDSILIESSILNSLHNNETLKNNAITNIIVDIFCDGLKAILFADIYYLDISKINRVRNTPNETQLPPVQMSLFATEVVSHNSTLIPMWKAKQLSLWSTNFHIIRNVNIDVNQSIIDSICDELKIFFDNSDEILLDVCIVVHNVTNNVRDILVTGSYRWVVHPMGSQNIVDSSIKRILDKIFK